MNTRGKLPPHPEEHWDFPPLFGPPDFLKAGDECDDQLAVFSKVGRGLRGDGFKVVIKSDEDAETYLEGLNYDANTNTYSTEWISENINGGQMMYQYNLRPYTIPQTFTITFRYKRPNRSNSEWVWTTPAIPYIWDADNDGLADVDEIVGTGVAALFLKKTTEPQWYYPTITYTDYKNGLMTAAKHDKLVYPDDWTREMFNAPIPGDPWSVNLQYGIGGDIDAPNIDDLAKILGITVQQIRNIINDIGDPNINGDGISGNNFKDYIDDLNEHIHADMGFDEHLVRDDNDVVRNTIKKYIDGLRFDIYKNAGITDPSDTDAKKYNEVADLDLTYLQKHGPNKGTVTHHTTVKSYIDARCDDLEEGLGSTNAAIQNILNKIYGGGTLNADGSITWNAPLNANDARIAAGDINLYSGNSESHGIYTHTGSSRNNDIKAV